MVEATAVEAQRGVEKVAERGAATEVAMVAGMGSVAAAKAEGEKVVEGMAGEKVAELAADGPAMGMEEASRAAAVTVGAA